MAGVAGLKENGGKLWKNSYIQIFGKGKDAMITTREEAIQRINLLEDLILCNEDENRAAADEIDALQYLIDNNELE